MTERAMDQKSAYWRIAGWGLLVLLLLTPLVAMQFTNEVDWTGSDFVIMGILLLALGLGFELAVRLSSDLAYRAGFGLAVLSAFLLIWVNLAVGIIGSEDNPANLMYFVLLAIGLLGAILVRGRPRGMAGTMLVMAGSQTVIAVVAILGGLGQPWNGPIELAAGNGLFVALFLTSSALFRIAARDKAARDEADISQVS